MFGWCFITAWSNNVKIMVLLILEKFSNIKMIIFHKEIIPNRMNK